MNFTSFATASAPWPTLKPYVTSLCSGTESSIVTHNIRVEVYGALLHWRQHVPAKRRKPCSHPRGVEIKIYTSLKSISMLFIDTCIETDSYIYRETDKWLNTDR
jgi:hypothetical protein